MDSSTEHYVSQVPGLMAELEKRASTLFNVELAPEPEALLTLERMADFLWQMRDSFDDQDRRINILLLGTYLGEVVRRELGGAWQVDPTLGLPLVMLPDGQAFNPMGAVQQRLDEGEPPLYGVSSGTGDRR
jgi:hypothetical protein